MTRLSKTDWASLALATVGPVLLVLLHDVRQGDALSVFSGNDVSSDQAGAACAYMAAYLASWLLTPTILLSLLLQRWLGWFLTRYPRSGR